VGAKRPIPKKKNLIRAPHRKLAIRKGRRKNLAKRSETLVEDPPEKTGSTVKRKITFARKNVKGQGYKSGQRKGG